jgi:hypothetical protein
MCGCECDCNKEELFIECPSCGEVAIVFDVFGEGDFKVYACGNCADAGAIDEISEPVYLEYIGDECVNGEQSLEDTISGIQELFDLIDEFDELDDEDEEDEKDVIEERSTQMSREILEYMVDEGIDEDVRCEIVRDVLGPICNSHPHIIDKVGASVLIALNKVYPYNRQICKGEFVGDYFIQPDCYFDYVWLIFEIYMTHRNEGITSIRIKNCVNAINIEVYN